MRGRTETWCARRRVLLAVCLAALFAPAATAQTPNECDAGEVPDVIVGDIHQLRRWGTLGDITAYSVGTTSCNVGTCWLNWFSNTNDHPVIGGNMYRLKDGRFEQLGQSWLKHGFFALSEDLCDPDQCQGTDGTHLGVNCSDPYSSFLNGNHDGLGPKFEVNPSTGDFPYPATDLNKTGNAIYKRIQVHNDDLDPALNEGATYYVEAQYIARDDAAAGRNQNNTSYRQVWITNANYDLSFTNPDDVFETSSTNRERAAIFAWRFNDLSVRLAGALVENDGRIFVGSQATDLGDGVWSYEYAVQNINSHRAVGSFSVPLPFGANVENVGFHDVDYHSGEPYDGTDWEVTIEDGRITWSTESFDVDPNANAIRWGTLYNFRFDVDIAPTQSDVTLGLFRPGTPESVTSRAKVPAICDNDGICDLAEDCANCPSDCADQGGLGGCCGDATCDGGETSCSCFVDCGPPPTFEFSCNDGIDGDCDGRADCLDTDCCLDAACAGADGDGDGFELCDCDDGNPDAWAAPGEVDSLALGHDVGLAETVLTWSAPLEPGGTALSYEVLRSINPKNFVTSTVCVPLGDPELPEAVDLDLPEDGEGWYYLIRAANGCPSTGGELGRTSYNLVRAGRACP